MYTQYRHSGIPLQVKSITTAIMTMLFCTRTMSRRAPSLQLFMSRCALSTSHDDFAPKKKAFVDNEDEAITMIKVRCCCRQCSVDDNVTLALTNYKCIQYNECVMDSNSLAFIQFHVQQHISDNRVMLYMKGNPAMPMCGFSAKVVGILQTEGADFSSVNVLDYPAIREGVKKFS